MSAGLAPLAVVARKMGCLEPREEGGKSKFFESQQPRSIAGLQPAGMVGGRTQACGLGFNLLGPLGLPDLLVPATCAFAGVRPAINVGISLRDGGGRRS